ncbi:MAG TPA: TonB-dependent receptor [Bryobacteraceae bacterium]|nr:TonB-dependent receptor [Bryobacteraceae bacterium]
MSDARRLVVLVTHFSVAVICLLICVQASHAQSTFGTVLGTVKDPSGSMVPGAKVDLLNTGTNANSTALTNANGAYQFVNVEVGNYKLKVEAPGFQVTEYEPFHLDARETARLDVQVKVASQATTVNVEAVAVLQTDASNVAETKGSLELTNLPVSIGTRASGSTSAYSTLTAQPGVQIDANNNINVSGALPSQLSFTIDGISSVGPGSLGALTELFPSFNAIEEIKISETLNPAEFGGVADITTVSKSGTNEFHGGAFENVQNTAFNASDTFSHQVTPVKLNDFGVYLGGPIILPKLYNGRNKTFFFGSFEALRLPKSLTAVLSVPTQAMRNGDLSAYLDPSQGGVANALSGYPGNVIPANQINSFAQKLMNLIYPLPNYGPAGAIANNYLASYAIPINSAQGDVRVDQSLGVKHLVYVRYTYKNRRITGEQTDAYGNPSTPLLGEVSTPQIYNALAASYNWIVSPAIVNELRGGFSLVHRDVSYGITAQQAANVLGLTNLPGGIPPGYDIPTLSITGFMGIQGQANDTNPHEGTYQLLDTLTWTKQKHTLKFGGDYRYLDSLFTQVFNNYRMGNYEFNGSVLSQYLGNGAATPFASFLLGYPDLTTIASVINPNTNAYAQHYAFFGQDDWNVSRSLTINFGLRWEYHPGFHDKNNDVVNFDPYYTSTINGQTVNGAVILPNQAAWANINPLFVQSIAPTPLILASQAGVPSNLRFSSKRDFAPRVGFAWRIGKDNKTVLRGGYGRFIEALMSGTAINGWSVGSSDVGYFSNAFNSNGTPTYQFPYSFPSNIAQPGTQFFDLASEIKYKDPIVEEWNLTLERDLNKGIGIRLTYSGNHSYNIPTVVNADQVRTNTLGFNDPSVQASIPFPLMSYIAQGTSLLGYGNYNSGTVSVHKRSSTFQFEASYSYTRDLTNVNGAPYTSANGFVNEFGNTLSDPYNPSLDYGNTPYDRRQRFLVTFLYELPFGKGRAFFNNATGVLDRVIGGWELSGVGLIQSGPFMSVATLNDPSGTGYNIFNANGGRADTVTGVNPYAGQSINQWINPAAFVDPNNNIGRFGNSQSGAVVGPGTNVVSLSLIKHILLSEKARMDVGAQVSNIANHPNYAPPGNLTLGVAGFGQITSLQSAEGAGPRALQLTARITF